MGSPGDTGQGRISNISNTHGAGDRISGEPPLKTDRRNGPQLVELGFG